MVQQFGTVTALQSVSSFHHHGGGDWRVVVVVAMGTHHVVVVVVLALMVFLPLHTPVLKPDLDLAL